MSDKQAFIEMLARAKIPYRNEDGRGDGNKIVVQGKRFWFDGSDQLRDVS